MTFEKICAMIANHTDADPNEITPETTFDSLGIDSLETVEMVMDLEEELGIELELDTKISTVGEFLQFLQDRLGENK